MFISMKYLLLLCFTLNIQVQADDLIYDYFQYKNVRRLSVFSCENPNEDFRLLKNMNALGIRTSFLHPDSESFNISKQIFKKDYWAFGLFLDTRCQSPEGNKKVIEQTTNYRYYEGIHIWLVLGKTLKDTLKILNDTEYGLLMDLVVGIESEFGYDLWDVYNPSKLRGGSLNVTRFGTWDPNNGMNVTLTEFKHSRRSNLFGLGIKIGCVVRYQPANVSLVDHLEDITTKSLDPLAKYGHGILKPISELFNFTMEMETYADWINTEVSPEGGAVPELNRGKIDVVGSPASATLRYAVKPYGRMLLPGYPYRTFFLLRSDVKKLKWTELMTPFAWDAWYATTAMAVLTIMIITVIEMSEHNDSWLMQGGNALFTTLGTLCQQGLPMVPNYLSGRISLLFLLVFGVMLANYYSASVVSARLSEPPDKMNDSLYSLAKSHIPVASEAYRNVDDNLNARSVYEWEVNYFNEKVWKKMADERWAPVEEGLAKVGLGGYAYHTSAEVAYPYVETHWDDKAICDMTEVHVITPRALCFWERVDSPFTELWKIGLIKTMMVGLRTRTIKRWKPKTPYCSPLSRSLQSVTLFETAPAVIILVIGASLSGWIFYIERLMERTKNPGASVPKKKLELPNFFRKGITFKP